MGGPRARLGVVKRKKPRPYWDFCQQFIGISKMFNLKPKCEALSRDITRKRPILTCYLLIGASACCGIVTSVEWRSGDRVWRCTPYNHYLDGITLSSVLAYFRFQVTVPVIFMMCE